jgi:hypothetical protein
MKTRPAPRSKKITFSTQRERDLHAALTTSLNKSAEPWFISAEQLVKVYETLSNCETELASSKIAAKSYYSEITSSLGKSTESLTKLLAAQQELSVLVASSTEKSKQLSESFLLLETELRKSSAERQQLRLDMDQVREVMKQTRSECDVVMQEVFRLRREVIMLKATCKHLETLNQTPPRR